MSDPINANIKFTSSEERRQAHLSGSLLRAPHSICPRCGGDVPVPGRKGEYEGARSRTDNLTEICTRCGNDEAFEDIAGSLVPQSSWPVLRPNSATWENSRGFVNTPLAPRPMPHEVPELRLHLIDRWSAGGIFETTTRVAAHEGKVFGPPQAFAYVERKGLAEAELWWVKDEMLQLAVAAMPSIPGDVAPEEIELPSASGLMVFEKPFVGVSSEQSEGGARSIEVDAVLWSETSIEGNKALSISAYHYLDFARGLSTDELIEATASGSIFEGRVENLSESAMRIRGGAWAFLGRTDWLIGQRLDDCDHLTGTKVEITEERKRSLEEDRRLLAAFSVLVGHKLVGEVETIYAQRAAKRRAIRQGIAEPSNVRIVRLRQPDRKYEGDAGDSERHPVNWSHRWIVNGHMGWRLCGPKRSQRKLVFIRPHIKGPADKPLVVKDVVRAWVK